MCCAYPKVLHLPTRYQMCCVYPKCMECIVIYPKEMHAVLTLVCVVCVCVCMCLLSTPLHFSFVRFIFITVPVFHYICFVFEMNTKRRDFSVCAVLALCKLYFLVYTPTLLSVWLARNWMGWVKAHRGMEPLRPVWKNMSVLRKDRLQTFFSFSFFRNHRF